ncbi:putative secreted protein [Propionispora sp. 2/2-37]|uniref:hypothetical protein n=1 Tax=Propionispora sp. 2/2-37 TaxID=1677858 RepID=UPI0006BB6D0E|nr:hypothetical protein [Propionispora sp. 2/2-37]CUH95235.1 putative secreted protein [Propionispora sp. 2/2-37]
MRKGLVFVLVGLFMLAWSGSVFAWSPELEGQPEDFRLGRSQGYFIWHDDDGLHLRTTTKYRSHIFSGILHTDGRFTDVDGVRLEDNDRYKVKQGGHTIDFRFDTSGGADGIDFKVSGGKKVEFELYMDGHRISPYKIYGGEDNWHPESNRFKIKK